jgi:hypothetical protein
MNSYQLSSDNMQKENNTIIEIFTSNKYDASILNTMNNRKVKTKYEGDRKWVKFTYVGKETRIITRLLKNTKVNVSFTTNNTIGKILASQHQRTANKYDKCGVYQLTCPTCNMKYVGQTDIPFKVRFRERLHDFKYGNRKSKFATHLLDNGHSIGSINNVMETLHITDKGRMMDNLEKFYIFRETKLNNQINDKLAVKPNIIFETIVNKDPHRGLPVTGNQ